jgi:hypothetical protein
MWCSYCNTSGGEVEVRVEVEVEVEVERSLDGIDADHDCIAIEQKLIILHDQLIIKKL